MNYWDSCEIREHCYRIIPKDIADDPQEMILHGFDRVYQAFGKVGYKFRDAGHNHQFVVVSLNRKISKTDLKFLSPKFSIETDNGDNLSFV